MVCITLCYSNIDMAYNFEIVYKSTPLCARCVAKICLKSWKWKPSSPAFFLTGVKCSIIRLVPIFLPTVFINIFCLVLLKTKRPIEKVMASTISLLYGVTTHSTMSFRNDHDSLQNRLSWKLY